MYFAEYMDTHLIAGGHVPVNGSSLGSTSNSITTTTTSEQQTSKDEHASAIFMKKWFRTDRAIIMYLTSGTLQVCHFNVHAPSFQRWIQKSSLGRRWLRRGLGEGYTPYWEEFWKKTYVPFSEKIDFFTSNGAF
jgi:hypothetical protein